MKKIETPIINTMYEASDGKLFRYERECLIYEAKLLEKKLKKFDIKVNGVTRYFYQINSKEELLSVAIALDSQMYTGGYFEKDAKDPATDRLVGGLVGFGYRENPDGWTDDWWVQSVDDLRDELQRSIDKLKNLDTELSNLAISHGGWSYEKK